MCDWAVPQADKRIYAHASAVLCCTTTQTPSSLLEPARGQSEQPSSHQTLFTHHPPAHAPYSHRVKDPGGAAQGGGGGDIVKQISPEDAARIAAASASKCATTDWKDACSCKGSPIRCVELARAGLGSDDHISGCSGCVVALGVLGCSGGGRVCGGVVELTRPLCLVVVQRM
jgi:hypothetical protein